MNNQIKFIYGLEVHVQLNTKHKLFAYVLNDAYAVENQNVSIIDLGMTGTYPILNIQAVSKGIKAAIMLKTEVATNVVFDRKHYKYFDLPSSYQITQYHNPIGVKGKYYIGNNKIITIKDIHLECDAAKTKEYDNKIVIDYNRCGAPLVEIVTDPCFDNVVEIETFLNLLIQDLRTNDISEARFEMSQIRVDVNISMIKDNKSSPRLEIKNLNSIRSIKRAIGLVQELLMQDNIHEDHTIHYDEIKNLAHLARRKEKAYDYMYLHEFAVPSIPTHSLILKQQSITLNIDAIENLIKITNNKLDNGIINAIISTPNIRYVISQYQQQYDNTNLVNVINYTIEIRDDIVDADIDSLGIIVILIHKLCNKEILKSKVSELARIIADKEVKNKEEFLQYLNINNYILEHNLDKYNLDEIQTKLHEQDPDVINKIKQNPKVFQYGIGLILRSIPGITPKIATEILNKLLDR